jgi:hypothetical protein
MSYQDIRLESDGTVVAYLAPTFELTPQDQNEVLQSPRGQERGSIVRNNGLWVSEITAQGSFIHSEDMQQNHRDAIQTLFGQTTVTPRDQINRLRDYTVYASTQGYLELYNNANEYTATTDAGVDVQNGTYPVVSVQEMRMPEDGAVNQSRIDFLIRMAVGTPRGSEGPTQP